MKEQSATYRITDLDEAERPRERLAKHGPQVLSNAELLAILLRVGVPGENAVQVGQRLLHDLGGLPGIHRADFQEVCNQHGIGPAKVGANQSRHRAGAPISSGSAGGTPGHSQPG